MLLQTDKVKADLLEQIEEYQEEVNSHKQGLEVMRKNNETEMEALKDQLVSF